MLVSSAVGAADRLNRNRQRRSLERGDSLRSTAGFAETCQVKNARQFLTEAGVDVDVIAPQVHDKFFSAFIRANKPKTACCKPGCCTPALAGAKE